MEQELVCTSGGQAVPRLGSASGAHWGRTHSCRAARGNQGLVCTSEAQAVCRVSRALGSPTQLRVGEGWKQPLFARGAGCVLLQPRTGVAHAAAGGKVK